ncbi:MAG: transposase [Thaumarchaeota archaeon]|nr:transposase [Candidatus Geocrenenecus arthurdayi]
MFTYRRLQQSVISKAIEYGVSIVIVDPRNTSSTCPGCGEI